MFSTPQASVLFSLVLRLRFRSRVGQDWRLAFPSRSGDGKRERSMRYLHLSAVVRHVGVCRIDAGVDFQNAPDKNQTLNALQSVPKEPTLLLTFGLAISSQFVVFTF